MDEYALKVEKSAKRRVAVFLDGTWNVVENNTNVWRLYSLCAPQGLLKPKPKDADAKPTSIEQIRYYTKGVGTSYGSKYRGGMLGAGFNDIIVETYEWLVEHYNPGDELYIFGFSRGAYAARSLAGFIALCGLLRPGSPIGVGELFERYRVNESVRSVFKLHDDKIHGKLGELTTLEKWMLDYATLASIKMVGVWDSVGALHGNYAFLHTGLRRSIENVYHALAIDENRGRFAPTLYTRNLQTTTPRPVTAVEQRWFVGAHANVGGGYASDLLPQISLMWMMKKAAEHGLAFRETLALDEQAYLGKPRDSYREFMGGLSYALRFGRRYWRTIGQADMADEEFVNETIDSSVFDKWRADESYRPANVVAWARAHNVDPKAITVGVSAKDPKIAVP